MEPPFGSSASRTERGSGGRQPRATKAAWPGAAQETVMGSGEWELNRDHPNVPVFDSIQVLLG